MKSIKKTVISLVVSIFLSFAFLIPSFAAGAHALEKLYDTRSGLMSVSYRGSGVGEKENSVAAVAAAVKAGADMVSVSVEKSGNSFVLSGTGDSLEEAAETVRSSSLLLIDDIWDERDELASFAKERGFLSSIVLRTCASEKSVAEWSLANPGVTVVGVYGGNVVFNAISHLKTAKQAGQPLVQYQSKNYFNVMYNSYTASRYSAEDDGTANPRALAPTYDGNLCGKRGDNVVGWDELFDRGFSVIETRNIKGLISYIREADELRSGLESDIEGAQSADVSKLSSVGAKNLEKALTAARAAAIDKNSPLSALQSADSALRAALYSSDPGNEKAASEKGSLNITAGKVAAVVFFGALIFAAQVFVFRKRK